MSDKEFKARSWQEYRHTHDPVFRLVLLVLYSALTAQMSLTQSMGQRTYDQALHAAFGHDKGLRQDQLVIRILSSVQPESEILFEKHNAKTVITYLELKENLWSDFRRSLVKSASESGLHAKIPTVNKSSVPISSEDASLYASELKDINLSTTAARVKTARGNWLETQDTTTYELLINGGTTRVKITDTSTTDFMSSENPRLLGWVLSVRRSVESALAYSAGQLVKTGDTTSYRNSYFAVSYTVPSMLVTTAAGTDGNAGGTSGTLLQAWEEPSPGRGRAGVVLLADYVRDRPHVESPIAYLDKFASFIKSQGFKVRRPPTTQKYNGTLFARADFSKSEMGLPIFESEFVIFRKNFALAFIFTGSTLDEIDHLAQSLSSFAWNPAVGAAGQPDGTRRN